MKILADQNMPLVEAYFSHLGDVERFDGRHLTPEQLHNVDALLIRSVTTIDDAVLAQANKLKFIGTATIGMDHVDKACLVERNIRFTNAPGCNAVAVAEYVISTLCALAQQQHFALTDKVVGIVGVGSIGSRLHKKLTALGIKTLLCDPFVAQTESEYQFVSYDTLIAQADVISFHVPLVKEGPFATRHLLNETTLSSLKDNAIIINASRGDVIDNQALLACLEKENSLTVVLDVWENEPNIAKLLLSKVEFGSVHIAGHTLEGKARGTEMLYHALCQLSGDLPRYQLNDFLPAPAISHIKITETFCTSDIINLVHSVYDVRRDHGLMTQLLDCKGFDYLRKHYPTRREFSALTVECATTQQAQMLEQLGFNIGNRTNLI